MCYLHFLQFLPQFMAAKNKEIFPSYMKTSLLSVSLSLIITTSLPRSKVFNDVSLPAAVMREY